MWYFVWSSTSLSLTVNYVLCTADTCHSKKCGPRQNLQTCGSKRYEFQTIAYNTYNDGTCTAQTCPVDGTETCPVDGKGADCEADGLAEKKREMAVTAARPVDGTVEQQTSPLKCFLVLLGILILSLSALKSVNNMFLKKRCCFGPGWLSLFFSLSRMDPQDVV